MKCAKNTANRRHIISSPGRKQEKTEVSPPLSSILLLFLRVSAAAVAVGTKKHKESFSFFLALFSDKKRGKSHLRGFSILLKIFFRVHELVARAMRGKCVRQIAKRKSAVLRSPRFQLYHACEHNARGSRADSCTRCPHARYKCKAGVNNVSEMTGLSK